MSTFPSYRGVSLYFGDPDDSKVDLIGVASDPSAGAGLSADLNTVAISPGGLSWTKTGAGDTDWTGGGQLGGGGVSGNVPFCLADGSEDNIPLTDGKVPFLLADGTPDNIGLV